jgi:outer membrane lipoprotein SlyB
MSVAGMSACGPSYSPDTYASNAAQQANKVEQGVVVGMRKVAVSAAGTVGTLTGAAAGGIAGSQVGVGPISAFSALGGSLVGGLAGSTAEHATGDTSAFEYIVRKPNGDLVSVTQKDKTPLVLGQKVLVIAGVQARVVPDYTVPPATPATSGEIAKPDAAAPSAKPAADATEATHIAAEPGSTPPIVAAPAVASPATALPHPVGTPAAAESTPGEVQPVAPALGGMSSAAAWPSGPATIASSGPPPVAAASGGGSQPAAVPGGTAPDRRSTGPARSGDSPSP